MANWNLKLLEKLAELSQSLAQDESISEPARKLFASALALADRREGPEATYGDAAQVFKLMSAACREAHLCGCVNHEPDARQCDRRFYDRRSCPLVDERGTH